MFDMNEELNKNSPQKLTESESEVFEKLEQNWSQKFKGDREALANFILPFIKVGLTFAQVTDLLNKVPEDWGFDHKNMYYDFRLTRWIKHIDPKDLTDTVKDYLVNAHSLEEGVLYVQKILADLSRKMGDVRE